MASSSRGAGGGRASMFAAFDNVVTNASRKEEENRLAIEEVMNSTKRGINERTLSTNPVVKIDKNDSKKVTKQILTAKTSPAVIHDSPLPSIHDEKEEMIGNNNSNGYGNNNNNNVRSSISSGNSGNNRRSIRSVDLTNLRNGGDSTFITNSLSIGSATKETKRRSSMLGELPLAEVASRLSDLSKKDLELLQKKQQEAAATSGNGSSSSPSPNQRSKQHSTAMDLNNKLEELSKGSGNGIGAIPLQKQLSHSKVLDPITNTPLVDEERLDDEDEDDDGNKLKGNKNVSPIPKVADPTGLGHFILVADERKFDGDDNFEDNANSDISGSSSMGSRFVQRLSIANIGKILPTGRSDRNITNQQDAAHQPSSKHLTHSASSLSSTQASSSTMSITTSTSMSGEMHAHRHNRRVSVTNIDSVYPVHENRDDFEITNPVALAKVKNSHAISYHPGLSHDDPHFTDTHATQENGNESSIHHESNASLDERMHPFLGTIDPNFFTERRNTRTGRRQSVQVHRHSLRATQSDIESSSSHSFDRSPAIQKSRSETDDSMRNLMIGKQGSIGSTTSHGSNSSGGHEAKTALQASSEEQTVRKVSTKPLSNIQELPVSIANQTQSNATTNTPAKNSDAVKITPPPLLRESSLKETDPKVAEAKRGVFSNLLSRMRSGTLSLSQRFEEETIPNLTPVEQKPSISPEMQKRIKELTVWLQDRDPGLVPNLEVHCTKLLMKYEMENLCRAIHKRYNALPAGWYVYLPEQVRERRLSTMVGNIEQAKLDSNSAYSDQLSHNQNLFAGGNLQAISQIEKYRMIQEQEAARKTSTPPKKESGASATGRRFSLFSKS